MSQIQTSHELMEIKRIIKDLPPQWLQEVIYMAEEQQKIQQAAVQRYERQYGNASSQT